jgi:hypothetical protein
MSMRHAFGTKLWAIGSLFVGVAASSACGGSSHRTEADPVAGADSAAGSDASAGRAGNGASAGDGANGAEGGNAGTSTAGAPPVLDLIKGDPECPPMAAPGAACAKPDTSCVYRTIPSGISSFGPAHCACKEGTWACVNSDENGDSACPLTAYPPGADDPCPPAGTVCKFAVPGQHTVATCSCSGIGAWFCGL